MSDLEAMLARDEEIRSNPELRCDGKVNVVMAFPGVKLPSLSEVDSCAGEAMFDMVFTRSSGVLPRKACDSCCAKASVLSIIHTVIRIDGEEAFNYGRD